MSHFVGIVCNALPLPIGRSIAARLGVAGHPFSPVALAMSFMIYHSLKQGNRHLITIALQSGNFTPLLAVAREVAAFQCSEFSSSFQNPHFQIEPPG